jgi:hypoxanthine phosphoribosyltransferase
VKPVLTHPSYNDIEKGCGLLATHIIRNLDDPDIIVGLARGGLVPAVILSHIMNVKMIPISYSSKKGQGEYKQYENTLPLIPYKNILIMDDIIDSGHTMKEVHDYYADLGHSVKIASLYWKEGSVIEPEYYWQYLTKDDPWIIFSWEV